MTATSSIGARLQRVAPQVPVSAVAALLVHERVRDTAGVAMPRAEVQLVARFGPEGGLDIHALGSRPTVHRKRLPRGLRTVAARLRLGTTEAVLGLPASAIAGRVVPLEDLWGDATTVRLTDRLAGARDSAAAAAILERAIAERAGGRADPGDRAELALDAATRLTRTSVNAVADELGVSERNLRRIFRDVIGVSPKTFAKLARFDRAVRAAREDERSGWASIAAAAGYYDQAHLIAEFRAIAGVTPRALLGELRASLPLG